MSHFELPELDQKETKKQVEKALSKYRLYKHLAFTEKEQSITAGYNERFHAPTNTTSDSVAEIATYNVDEQERMKRYCSRMEWAVKKLPRMERFLIEERYMSEDAEYITDYNVYNFKFQPPISHVTYSKMRWKAFYKLALGLGLAVVKNKDKSNKQNTYSNILK